MKIKHVEEEVSQSLPICDWGAGCIFFSIIENEHIRASYLVKAWDEEVKFETIVHYILICVGIPYEKRG